MEEALCSFRQADLRNLCECRGRAEMKELRKGCRQRRVQDVQGPSQGPMSPGCANRRWAALSGTRTATYLERRYCPVHRALIIYPLRSRSAGGLTFHTVLGALEPALQLALLLPGSERLQRSSALKPAPIFVRLSLSTSQLRPRTLFMWTCLSLALSLALLHSAASLTLLLRLTKQAARASLLYSMHRFPHSFSAPLPSPAPLLTLLSFLSPHLCCLCTDYSQRQQECQR